MRNITLGLLAFILLSACSITKKGNKVVDNKSKKESYKVLMQSTAGDITIQLYEDVPQHAQNFLKLVKEGFYDGLLFHRVIPGFMIQGGDPQSKEAAPGARLGNGDIGYTIPAEFNASKYVHVKGALAAARTPNPEKASSGCQFYIVEGRPYTEQELKQMAAMKVITYTPEQMKAYMEVGGTPSLDNEYTVYGMVIEGMDIINKISSVKRDPADRPNEDVKIIKATIID